MTVQASWADGNITALLDFLLSKKATAGDGMAFKAVVWNEPEAATIVNLIPGHKGGPKTSNSCKNKYAKVTHFIHS
jgi:hypothetical protein